MSDDKKIIFSMYKVSKTYPQSNKTIIKDISLSFFLGAKIGIIGLNGAGKSTLLRIIAGQDKNFNGELVFAPGYSVGMLEQEPQLDENKTVIDVVKEGAKEVVDVLNTYEEINQKFGLPEVYENPDEMGRLMKEQEKLQEKIDQMDAWNLDSRLERAMDALQCPPNEQPVHELSGGERRRVALCRLLLQEPDVLLADEPTASLDPRTSEQIMVLLQSLASELSLPVLINIHNVTQAKAYTERIVGLRHGKMIFDGTPAEFNQSALDAIYGGIESPDETHGDAEQGALP